MTEADVKTLILAALVEHELIADPNSPQGRANALSREWHREQHAKREVAAPEDYDRDLEQAKRALLEACPPGDYCEECASRWCRCAEDARQRAARLG